MTALKLGCAVQRLTLPLAPLHFDPGSAPSSHSHYTLTPSSGALETDLNGPFLHYICEMQHTALKYNSTLLYSTNHFSMSRVCTL